MAPQASLPAADFGAAEGDDDKNFWALALGSVGVVFGDIGTSSLYAFKEAITAASHHATVAEATLGVLSLIFWSMTLVVTIKYAPPVPPRADNRGRGRHVRLDGPRPDRGPSQRPLCLGLSGSPAPRFFTATRSSRLQFPFSRPSKACGSSRPQFEVAVIPVALIVLTVLFWMQSHGTARVARFFGPIMVVWFAVALGGLMHIADNLHVLLALTRFTASNSSIPTACSG